MAGETKRKDEPPKTPPRRDPPTPPKKEPPPAPPKKEPASAPKKEPPKTVGYNQYGYVPGGSSKRVSVAIEAQAIVTPGSHPVQVPVAIEDDIPLSTEVVLPSGKVTTFGEATKPKPKPAATPKPGSEPVPHTGNLSHEELMQLWVDQGGNPKLANLAANIATCESGGYTGAIDNTAYPSRPKYHPPGKGASPEYSVGLWQINTVAHPQYSASAMLDAYANCAAIISISHNGANFAQTNVSCYRAATNAATDLTGGGTAVPEESTAGPPAVVASWRDLLAVFAKKVPKASASIKSNADGLWRLFT